MDQKKRIGIVGAGPGGLTAAMLLSSQGHHVTVYEQADTIGGRCGSFQKGPYSWDIGPTFLMYKELLAECFEQAGENINEHLDIIALDPMYELIYSDKKIPIHSDEHKLALELEKHFPGAAKQFAKFRTQQKKRFEGVKPVLQQDFSSFNRYLSPNLLKALPHLGLGASVFEDLNSVFKDEELTLAFTFQSKYLGMSAWKCPSLFSIIPHLEHEYGVHHVRGGLHKINSAMAKVAMKHGAQIHTGVPVRNLHVEQGKAKGLILDDGHHLPFDEVILNADFAFSMNNLIDDSFLKKYKREKVNGMKYSCSTYMMYLGIDRPVDLAFHSIVFAHDYKTNIADVFEDGNISQDISFYVRNGSLLDSSMAPEGHSALYVLVPVPNLKLYNNWSPEVCKQLRNTTLQALSKRLGLENIESAIKEEIVMTPPMWQEQLNVHYGATFNLAHSWDQLDMFRPHNAFNDIKSVYLVGGGTHPGSGLPTIYESGRIAARLINSDQ